MNDVIISDNNDNYEIIDTQKYEKEEKVKYLSENEVKLVINNAKSCYKVIFALLYELACRINEVLNLKYSDIHKMNYNNKNMIIVKVNNSKQKYKDYKEIVISAELYALLLEQKLKLNLSDDDFIARNSRNNKASETHTNRYMKKLFKYLNLDLKKAHTHVFRHSRAVHLLNQNISIADLKKILAHKNINNTLIYSNLSYKDINSKLINIESILK